MTVLLNHPLRMPRGAVGYDPLVMDAAGAIMKLRGAAGPSLIQAALSSPELKPDEIKVLREIYAACNHIVTVNQIAPADYRVDKRPYE